MVTSLTQRDASQIERHEHDESVDAKRVYIVGGADIKVNADVSNIASSVASAVKEGLADIMPSMRLEESSKVQIVEIEKPILVKETQIVEVEKQVIVKEPQLIEIEKQIVVKEKELVYVDKPVIIEKIVYKEIEKPILVNSSSQEKKPSNYHAILLGCMVLQTLTLLGIIVLKI